MNAEPIRFSEELCLIPLTPALAGFEGFIGAWLYTGGPRLLVDVGPAATAGQLLAALDRLGVRRLDFILLTHIHLDHCGAAGPAAEAFPGTPVVCHRSACGHLADPRRLWAGTRQVLGDTALAYGEPPPVAAGRLVTADDFAAGGIAVLPTPGHAAHHLSYRVGGYLFAGETAGVRIDLGPAGEYLRPATPPRFFLDTALESLERLAAAAPPWLCYGHFGLGESARRRLLEQRRQLLFWEQVIAAQVPAGETGATAEACCLRTLLEADPRLAGFERLPPAVRRRESYFLRNSVRGFLGWLAGKA